MRTLAIECATEACSTALFDGDECIGHFHEVIGRGHAETLVPAIAALPDQGKAQRILVSLGPGSFNGVRIGLAAARALGMAWNAEVLGYPTLALVAARSWQAEACPATVCMNAGHGEWFVQNYGNHQQAEDQVLSLSPQDAAKACRHNVIIGNRAQQLVDLLGDDRTALELLPDARMTNLLHENQMSQQLTPVYGRAPDAKLPGTN